MLYEREWRGGAHGGGGGDGWGTVRRVAVAKRTFRNFVTMGGVCAVTGRWQRGRASAAATTASGIARHGIARHGMARYGLAQPAPNITRGGAWWSGATLEKPRGSEAGSSGGRVAATCAHWGSSFGAVASVASTRRDRLQPPTHDSTHASGPAAPVLSSVGGQQATFWGGTGSRSISRCHTPTPMQAQSAQGGRNRGRHVARRP